MDWYVECVWKYDEIPKDAIVYRAVLQCKCTTDLDWSVFVFWWEQGFLTVSSPGLYCFGKM